MVGSAHYYSLARFGVIRYGGVQQFARIFLFTPNLAVFLSEIPPGVARLQGKINSGKFNRLFNLQNNQIAF